MSPLTALFPSVDERTAHTSRMRELSDRVDVAQRTAQLARSESARKGARRVAAFHAKRARQLRGE